MPLLWHVNTAGTLVGSSLTITLCATFLRPISRPPRVAILPLSLSPKSALATTLPIPGPILHPPLLSRPLNLSLLSSASPLLPTLVSLGCSLTHPPLPRGNVALLFSAFPIPFQVGRLSFVFAHRVNPRGILVAATPVHLDRGQASPKRLSSTSISPWLLGKTLPNRHGQTWSVSLSFPASAPRLAPLPF